jgi:predicted nucleic acid-binding protein
MARRQYDEAAAPQRLILDSGAVISLARGDQRARAYVARALELDLPIEVPAPVVAETTRGGAKDAPLNRALKQVGQTRPTTEEHGRVAGALLGKARSSSTLDALVVAHAVVGGGAIVLTGDTDDLGRLAEPHPEVWIRAL